jgi:GT2 family glycosyltransferase
VLQGWAATANLAVTIETLETVGGFDPAWTHIGEDVDLCLRARKSGFELGFCPEAVVTHDADRELGEFLRRSFRHGYSTTQAQYRLGVGHRAWREPQRAFSAKAALSFHGQGRNGMSAGEYRRIGALAQLSYCARIAGSVWAEMSRAR